jgi:prophage regulatory protein
MLLRLPEVRARTGLSRATIYLKMQKGIFPAPVKLGGPRAVGWLAGEVDLWIEDRIRESRGELADVAPQ